MLPLLLLSAATLGSTASAGTINASSFADTDEGKMTAAQAADGLLSTSWAEGVSGDGAGQWLELDLGARTELHDLSFWPGDLSQGKRSFREHGRPKIVHVEVDGVAVGGPVTILDQMQRVDIPMQASGRKVRLVIDTAYEGLVHSDTCIAELAINFPDLGPSAATWVAFLTSDSAKRLHDSFDETLLQKYQAYKDAQFGDRDALAWINDAAADGEPWMRTEAAKRIPVGYRAQAIASSDRAREALRKLKDPNAIPALEMAMLRTTGDERKQLAETVEVFYAYQEMVGNKDRTAPPWGESGFWRGALRSFDEPLAIARTQDGSLLVADTANNRVQRFGDNGLVRKVYGGGEPGITDAWFEDGRAYYVSGAQPGDQPGHFVNPLDVALIPGKDADGVAVLDAARRVQVFDGAGTLTAGWTVETDNRPAPRHGGEGYLVYLAKGKRLLAFIADECVVYDLSGTEMGRWQVEGGVPDAVVASPSGQLLIAFRDEVWEYAADGFAKFVRVDDQTLGRGFEDLGMTYDSAGKLWILTDDGVVHKYKKPGKQEFQVKIAHFSLSHPRLAVDDGIVWFTSDDAIQRVDAIQAKLDEETAQDAGEGILDLDGAGR